jgi:hypothetical protein
MDGPDASRLHQSQHQAPRRLAAELAKPVAIFANARSREVAVSSANGEKPSQVPSCSEP